MSEFVDPTLIEENERLMQEANGDIGLFYRLRALQNAEQLLIGDPDNVSFASTYHDMLAEVERYKQGSQ